MNRVKIFACAAAGMALAMLGLCLPAVDDLPAGTVSRSVGVALFGVAMVAAGLVFRAAMRTRKLPSSKAALEASEFRRGFDKGAKGTKQAAALQAAREREVVVALRRAVAEQAQRPAGEPAGLNLPADQIERLQDMLHSRAEALRARNAKQAKRHFLKSGVDTHGLAPN